MKQHRPRRFNPYMAYGFRRPYTPPYFFSPYGYGYVAPHISICIWCEHSFAWCFYFYFTYIKYPAGRFLGLGGQIVTCRTTRSIIWNGLKYEDGASWSNNFFIWALTLSSFSIIYSAMDCPFVLVLGCLNFYFSCLVIGRWLTIAIEYYIMLVIFLSVF